MWFDVDVEIYTTVNNGIKKKNEKRIGKELLLMCWYIAFLFCWILFLRRKMEKETKIDSISQ